MIKDAFGREAKLGDVIAYSQGNSGTSFGTSTIERITDKSIIFKGVPGSAWVREVTNLRRGAGQFVIKVEV